ncbi:MAG: hypothetical protein B6U87_00935 [Candidatus Aenigmarchaeota archaeon ex4484_52]|nr:MAG: hypothetical protein B6U87_00935 [Candidatus Aenigmarchaeota archaeon ex4484_52]
MEEKNKSNKENNKYSKIKKISIKKIKRQIKPIKKLSKANKNPIISPNQENEWETLQTFNATAIMFDDKVHFLYRAIGNDGISRLGYANSKDGFILDERYSEPVYEHNSISGKYKCYSFASGGSWGGCEDPRIVRVNNEPVFYITYTACDGGLRVGLTSIKINDFINGKWKWSVPKLISPPDEIHKNWVIFPEKIKGKYAILHSISPKILISYVDTLEFKEGEYIKSNYQPGKPDKKRWDSYVRGPGPSPIKTKYGWLLFYHAMNHKDMGKYKIFAMILDLEDPTKILHRSKEPIIVPEEFYEMYGGVKPGVVYALGAVIKDELLIVYYGGADSYVCAAYTNLEEFLEELTKETKKPIKLKSLKKKKNKPNTKSLYDN